MHILQEKYGQLHKIRCPLLHDWQFYGFYARSQILFALSRSGSNTARVAKVCLGERADTKRE